MADHESFDKGRTGSNLLRLMISPGLSLITAGSVEGATAPLFSTRLPSLPSYFEVVKFWRLDRVEYLRESN